MKKILFAFFMALLVINLVNAEQQSLGVFRQDSCIELLQTCADCTYVNISSVLYPDSSEALGEVSMTRSGTKFNYTSCAVAGTLGQYIVNYYGNPGGIKTVGAYTFDVTANGAIQTTGQSIAGLAFIILILIITIILGILAFRFMDSDTLWVLGIFFFVFFLLLIIYNIWLAFEFKQNYTGASPDSIIPQTLFITFLTVLLAGFGSALILLLKKWKKIVKLFKNAIKPEPEDDDEYFDSKEFN